MKKIGSGANYARYEIGRVGVIALRDGYVDMPSSRLRQSGDQSFGSALPEQVELIDGKLRLSVNAFLVVDGDQHILIDTGAANSWEPTMGLLPEALAEAGVDRGAINTVALTHTHSDHANGLVAADGSDAFPNLARVLVPREELPMFDKNDRLVRFRQRRLPLDEGFKVSASITAIQAHGHEVGHTAFEVSSEGDKLLIWGDIIHVPSVQFARPDLTWEFDFDQEQARLTRWTMLRRVVESRSFVAGAHLDFPGVGAVIKSDDGFRYAML